MNYYNEIRQEFINNEITKKIKDYSKNRSDLQTYYNVGKLIVEAQGGVLRAKYGNSLIHEYSNKLSQELNKNYSERNLRNMRRFYLMFKDNFWNAMRSKLSWTHYRELLKLNDINEINYYINASEKQNLSYRELREKIRLKEYQRLKSDFKDKLINKDDIKLTDHVKDPILIKNNDIKLIREKTLQKLILEDIPSFLNELGDGFCFIKNEYKIKIGNTYNYIDILLFNYIYNCFVVIELKVTELKKEHIGQIKTYMNYIDKNIRQFNQDKTIGIIIVKRDNKFIMEYCSDDRIISRNYEFI